MPAGIHLTGFARELQERFKEDRYFREYTGFNDEFINELCEWVDAKARDFFDDPGRVESLELENEELEAKERNTAALLTEVDDKLRTIAKAFDEAEEANEGIFNAHDVIKSQLEGVPRD